MIIILAIGPRYSGYCQVMVRLTDEDHTIKVFLKGPTMEKGWLVDMLQARSTWTYQTVFNRSEADLLILEHGVGWSAVEHNSNQVTIFWSGENFAWQEQINAGGHFDIFSGFMWSERVASNRYMRMPYPFLEFFNPSTCFLAPSLERLLKKSKVQQLQDWRARQVNVSFLASHMVYPRQELIELLNKAAGPVNCSGVCGESKKGMDTLFSNEIPEGIPNPSKYTFLKQSKFNICPENSVGNGYTTEKLFDALLAGTVPVYWPTRSMNPPEEWLINPERILFYDDSLVSSVQNILQNDEYQEHFFEKPIIQRTAATVASQTCNTFQRHVEESILSILHIRSLSGETCTYDDAIVWSPNNRREIILKKIFFGMCSGSFYAVFEGDSDPVIHILEDHFQWDGNLVEPSHAVSHSNRTRSTPNHSFSAIKQFSRINYLTTDSVADLCTWLQSPDSKNVDVDVISVRVMLSKERDQIHTLLSEKGFRLILWEKGNVVLCSENIRCG